MRDSGFLLPSYVFDPDPGGNDVDYTKFYENRDFGELGSEQVEVDGTPGIPPPAKLKVELDEIFEN